MNYLVYVAVGVPVAVLLYKCTLATLDQGFRWLAERMDIEDYEDPRGGLPAAGLP